MEKYAEIAIVGLLRGTLLVFGKTIVSLWSTMPTTLGSGMSPVIVLWHLDARMAALVKYEA
jgi:hypothetical protein